MKDTISSLLLFLLVFAAIVCVFTGFYFLYLFLVPGGKGLIFSNPFVPALLAGLLGGLIVALYHIVHNPGKFILTYTSLTLFFFFLLVVSLPLILKMPSLRTADAAPLHAGRFLALSDGSQIYQPANMVAKNSGQFFHELVFVPADEKPLLILKEAQYDPLNFRFLFSNPAQPAASLKEISAEQDYFGYPPLIRSFQLDFFKVYLVLRTTWENDPLRFYLTAFCLSVFFMGLLFFFSLKTWPLIQWVFVLVLARFMVSFTAFCLWDIPPMIEPWFSSTSVTFYKLWTPVFLLGLSASVLFFMTLLTKPHRTLK